MGLVPVAVLLAASAMALAPATTRAGNNDPATYLSIATESGLPGPVAGVPTVRSSSLPIRLTAATMNASTTPSTLRTRRNDRQAGDYGFSHGIACGPLGALGGDLGLYWIQFVPIKSGSQTLTVSDVTNPSVTSASVTIDVAPAPATHLAVSGPTNAVTGAGATITVSAMDQWNNVDTNYTGSIDFVSTDTAATFHGVAQPADYTFVSGDNGPGSHSRLRERRHPDDHGHGLLPPSITGNTVTHVSSAPHFDIQVQDQQAGVYTSCSVTAMNANGTPDPPTTAPSYSPAPTGAPTCPKTPATCPAR